LPSSGGDGWAVWAVGSGGETRSAEFIADVPLQSLHREHVLAVQEHLRKKGLSAQTALHAHRLTGQVLG
jgi:hypothetical protein